MQDSPSILFNTSKKLEFTVDRQYVLNRKNVKPGKKYSYTLDAAVLRDTKKVHFSAYITINGVDYGFDGESYSRLEKFNWKSKLNKNTQYKFTIPGIYAYWCTPHKSMGMIGFVVVGENKENLPMIRKVKFFGKSKKIAKGLLEKL